MTEFALKTWENAIDGIAKAFLQKYFPEEVSKGREFWCGGDVGGVFCVAFDLFFSADFMLRALQLNATREQVEKFNEWERDYYSEDPDKLPPFTSFEYYMKNGVIS